MDEELDAHSMPKFANSPKNLRFESPRRIANAARIWIGDDVSLGPGCLLSATRRYPGKFMQGAADVEIQEFDPVIRIGDRVSVTGYLTIGAASRVEIGNDALLDRSVLAPEEVLRLEIPVDDPFGVGGLEAAADLASHVHDLPRAQ